MACNERLAERIRATSSAEGMWKESACSAGSASCSTATCARYGYDTPPKQPHVREVCFASLQSGDIMDIQCSTTGEVSI